MLFLEAGEAEKISKGHVPILKEVLTRSLEEYKRRLIREQNNVQLVQGYAQILEALVELLD